MSTEPNEVKKEVQEKKSRLERLEQRIIELQRQRKRLQLRENEKERKARTRRLIQIGAISLQYLNMPDTTEPNEFEQSIRKKLGIPEKESKE